MPITAKWVAICDKCGKHSIDYPFITDVDANLKDALEYDGWKVKVKSWLQGLLLRHPERIYLCFECVRTMKDVKNRHA